jgi:Zn-dependent peptidase ImmA (M78 family)
MRDKIKLNSFAVELRRDWDLNPYSPIDLFSIVLSKLPDLTILFYPMSDNTSGMCIKNIDGIDLDELMEDDSIYSDDDSTSNDMVICINSNMSKGRQRFTLAHELYHLLFEEDKRNLIICETSNDDDSEIEANIFASYLIMTYEGLERYAKINRLTEWTLEEVIRAEQYFQISHHAMLFRLREHEFISHEECKRLRSVQIGYSARINGFSDSLYTPTNTSKKYFSLGKYIRLVERAFNDNKISPGKRDELLLDAFRSDLTKKFF